MTVQNQLHQADCLDLLPKLLPKSVTVAYCDPPWPTWDQPLDKYFTFLIERIALIFPSLTDQGSFYIQLPPTLTHYARVLIEKVSGDFHYQRQFIIPKRIFSTKSQDDYEVILLYGKDDEMLLMPQPRYNLIREQEEIYQHSDERGPYKLVTLFTPPRNERPLLAFEWNGITPPPGKNWRYKLERLDQLLADDRIAFTLSRKLPSLKVYLSESQDRFLGSIWDDLSKSVDFPRLSDVGPKNKSLMCRIIQMSSQPGDLVLDPFCGSGTTLVAAQSTNRRWIGCEISEQAINYMIHRLKEEFGIEVAKDYGYEVHRQGIPSKLHNTKKETSRFEQAIKLVINNSLSFDVDYSTHNQVIPPMIYTEGKTDWKHLKTAYERFKAEGFGEAEFELKFDEFEDENRGDSELLKLCEFFCKKPNTQPVICIFDRDVPSIVDKVMPIDAPFKSWGNYVYSFAIPVPTHRLDTPEVCIEHYYLDEEIMREDEKGRRLFMAGEFKSISGFHNSRKYVCRAKGIDGANKIRIIGEKVYDFDNQNIALPKNDFAEYIMNGHDNFNDLDLREFTKIFDVIAQIIRDANKPSEPQT